MLKNKRLKLVKCIALLSYSAVLLSLSMHSVRGAVDAGSPNRPSTTVQDGESGEAYLDDHPSSSEAVIIGDGESLSFYEPHHAGNSSHDTHYFTETGDDHHFGWFSSTPSSPGPINIKYDFRDQGSFVNSISPAQELNAVAALNAWSAATGGKLIFTQDTLASASSIINIGTGDLAALGSTSGPGGTLALGGGNFTHSGPTHSITGGIAWQDSSENWDTTIGNGNPGGTFDYFTVVAQEIGHALGLGHVSGADIMNGNYAGELTALSATDISHFTSIYGVDVVPEPSSVLLLAAGSMMLLGRRRRV